jgi:DNA-binding PadR family transcriptional regulator
MSKNNDRITEKQAFKILFMLQALGRYKYLLLDEFHQLCADQVKGITNFYPYLRLMERYKYIEAYQVFDNRIARVISEHQRNRHNTLYRLSPFGWEYLRNFDQLTVSIDFPLNTIHEVEIAKPGEMKFTKLIHHDILVTQVLAKLISMIHEKQGGLEITFYTDHLLRRVVGESGDKIPDFLIYYATKDGELRRIWGECERSRKKNSNTETLMSGIGKAYELGFSPYIFYPTNAKNADGFLISHKKNIIAGAKKYMKVPANFFLWTFELMDRASSSFPLLGGKNIKYSEKISCVPNLYRLMGIELDGPLHWEIDSAYEANTKEIVFAGKFLYFISKKSSVYIVAPVIRKTFNSYGQISYYEEIEMSQAIRCKSRQEALAQACIFMVRRYSETEFLLHIKGRFPITYKHYLNLQRSKANFLDREIKNDKY